MRNVVLGMTVAGLLALGAFGEVGMPWADGHMNAENLVLIAISALELSPSQMEALLQWVEGLLPLREEIVRMPEKLHEELLKFTGSAAELRQMLQDYQAALREKLQALEAKFLTGLKKILTVAQWERLQRGFGLAEQERVRERLREEVRKRRLLRERWAPQPEVGRPLPGFGLELWRGMSLVRILPILQEALAAKLEALGK
ncbi:MAG: hypothetical protein ACUVQS_06580 [Candidatus Bipolaricaulaceae bacterium]